MRAAVSMAFPNSARSAGSANAANTRSDRRGTGPLENKGRVLQILGCHGTFLIRESMELYVGAAAWRDGLQAEFRASCRLADDCDMQPVASSHIWLAFAKRFFGTEDERFQSLGLSHQPHTGGGRRPAEPPGDPRLKTCRRIAATSNDAESSRHGIRTGRLRRVALLHAGASRSVVHSPARRRCLHDAARRRPDQADRADLFTRWPISLRAETTLREVGPTRTHGARQAQATLARIRTPAQKGIHHGSRCRRGA